VGALGHYLEEEGIPTTQISLIREHTEVMRPPRALWVPFELGRPLGVPFNTALQRRVLVAALELLNFSDGPVLADFPDDVPERIADRGQMPEGWACPVSFAPAIGEEKEDNGALSALRREITELRPWYDLSVEKRDRTSVAYFAPEAASQFFSAVVLGEPPQWPETLSSPAVALRLAAQDLKAFYFESVTARPSVVLPEASEFNRWFWQETAAGRVLKLVKKTCMHTEDKEMRKAAAMFLIPVDQA
jgi:hypothetical protein